MKPAIDAHPLKGLMLGTLLMAVAAPASALVIAEGSNFSFAGAQNVDASFSTDFVADIADLAGVNTSTSLSHVSILGTSDDTFDYYSFTASAGSLGIFDIDYGDNNFGIGHLDTEIALWAADGTLLATNDDGDTNAGYSAAGDAGSAHIGASFDSFIQYIFATSGTYVIGVAEFNSTPVAGGWDNTSNELLSGTYTLHISVPEPATYALFAVGLLGLFGLRMLGRRRRSVQLFR